MRLKNSYRSSLFEVNQQSKNNNYEGIKSKVTKSTLK